MKRLLPILLPALLFSIAGLSQGCSDAGFCSLKYHATQGEKDLKNSLSIGNVSGGADGNTFVNGTYISYRRVLKKDLFWDTRITANYASGSLATNFNIGDLFTNISLRLAGDSKKDRSVQLLGGLKIPLSAANDKAGGKPLPMAYQSSLGTWDALLGLQYKVKNWEFTNAWQIPLTMQNRNSFFKEYSLSSDFPSTNKFGRRPDLLLRAAYQLNKLAPNFSLRPNILAIWHLGEDTYEDISSKRQPITGSSGLTLNANIIGTYRINAKNSIELSLATPFLVRDIRPDGLTRSYTAGIEYRVSF